MRWRMPVTDLDDALAMLEPWTISGRIVAARASSLHCAGLGGLAAVGDTCRIDRARSGAPLLAEVAAFQGDNTVLLPYGDPQNVALGAAVTLTPALGMVRPSAAWLGRVLDPMARPLDDAPPPPPGPRAHALYAHPPSATRNNDRKGRNQWRRRSSTKVSDQVGRSPKS